MKLPDKSVRHTHFGSTSPARGNKPTVKHEMPDIQSTEKDYYFHIDQVGVKKLTYPIWLEAGTEPNLQQTIGDFTITTALNQNKKGINMSRIPETLHQFYKEGTPLNLSFLREFTRRLAEKMEQTKVYAKVVYPWFFSRYSPVTKLEGVMDATVSQETVFEAPNHWVEKVGMQATVTTLCPCSKEISEYSAHNQRGVVTIEVENYAERKIPDDFKECLLNVIESNASARIHPLLKRPDEKKVTEEAFENPRFVEDLIRLIAASLIELDWVKTFTIECQNEESIHLHDAFASLTYDKEVNR